MANLRVKAAAARTANVASFEKNYKKTGQISFAKSGRNAAYRGTARSQMKLHGNAKVAHRVAMKAGNAAGSRKAAGQSPS